MASVGDAYELANAAIRDDGEKAVAAFLRTESADAPGVPALCVAANFGNLHAVVHLLNAGASPDVTYRHPPFEGSMRMECRRGARSSSRGYQFLHRGSCAGIPAPRFPGPAVPGPQFLDQRLMTSVLGPEVWPYGAAAAARRAPGTAPPFGAVYSTCLDMRARRPRVETRCKGWGPSGPGTAAQAQEPRFQDRSSWTASSWTGKFPSPGTS